MTHSVLNIESSFVELLLDQQTLSIQSPTGRDSVSADRRPAESSGRSDFQSTSGTGSILVDDDEQYNLLEHHRLPQPIQPSSGTDVHAGQIVQVQRLSRPADDCSILRLPRPAGLVVADPVGQSRTALRKRKARVIDAGSGGII